MIDFEKEEFLQRLDLRIHIIAGLIESHEKYLVATTVTNRSQSRGNQNEIGQAIKEFLKRFSEMDKQIQEHFDKMKN